MRQSSFFCVSRATGVLKRAAQQGEAVALRKSPVRTPAMLAANRANAKKSTGQSTASCKARAALNPPKHGAYAVRFPETLLRAGDLQGAALYRWFRSEIAATFKTGRSADERQAHGIGRCEKFGWRRPLRTARPTIAPENAPAAAGAPAHYCRIFSPSKGRD